MPAYQPRPFLPGLPQSCLRAASERADSVDVCILIFAEIQRPQSGRQFFFFISFHISRCMFTVPSVQRRPGVCRDQQRRTQIVIWYVFLCIYDSYQTSVQTTTTTTSAVPSPELSFPSRQKEPTKLKPSLFFLFSTKILVPGLKSTTRASPRTGARELRPVACSRGCEMIRA